MTAHEQTEPEAAGGHDDAALAEQIMDVIRNVTESKPAENALLESEADFAALADKSLQGILIFQDLRIVYANPAGCRMHGYTSEELRAMRPEEFLAIVHPLDRRISDERARKRLAGENVEPAVELRIVSKDGSTRWIQSFNNPIEFRGRPAILSTSIDITERKNTEDALRAAEQRLQHIVASNPAVLFTLQIKDGAVAGISWMSENVETMLGYRVDETLGADWWLANVHSDDRIEAASRFLTGIFERNYSAGEYRFRHKDGSFRWIRSETRLLRDAVGRAEEVVGSLSDVTERKRFEDLYLQAQKMEALGQLAGGVAHDFNNLMTVISGYCQILLSGLRADDPSRPMISQIRQAGERAAKLTRQLLSFSHRTVLEPKVLDLNKVVGENEEMLRQLIGEDVQLVVSLCSMPEPVKVDPSQIGQIIVNLAVNARDAMPEGGRLCVETANVTLNEADVFGPEAKVGRYVVLALTDTGTGMTAEVQAHIFEPFFTTKGVGKGTGLGLSTVYGIVRQNGGWISVESNSGRGSAFKIYFPVAEGHLLAGAPAAYSEPLAGGSETVLLVEDEEAVRSVVRIALREMGYSVLEARHGSAALQIASEQPGPIHLLITDVVMPEMGGRELVKRLTRLRPDMRVLYVSGYTDDAIVRHGVLLEEVAFLQKPFTMTELTNKVRRVLGAGSN